MRAQKYVPSEKFFISQQALGSAHCPSNLRALELQTKKYLSLFPYCRICFFVLSFFLIIITGTLRVPHHYAHHRCVRVDSSVHLYEKDYEGRKIHRGFLFLFR